jgi:hypothetical protein
MNNTKRLQFSNTFRLGGTGLCAVLAALTLLGASAVAQETPLQLPDSSPKPAAKHKVGYPHFSWDRVPVYAHVGLGDGLKLEQGMFAMLREAKQKMGKDSIILLNPLHGPKNGQKQEEALGWRYLDVVDGAMVDDFDRAANIIARRQSKVYIADTIKTMSAAARRGEIVVFKAWPGFTWWSDKELMKKSHAEQVAVSVKNLEFPLACFLIGTGEHCYFCYTWGWLPEYGTFDWYPDFDRPLGAPKGDAVQTDWTFPRDFEHASVFVDLENRIGKIDWRKRPASLTNH